MTVSERVAGAPPTAVGRACNTEPVPTPPASWPPASRRWPTSGRTLEDPAVAARGEPGRARDAARRIRQRLGRPRRARPRRVRDRAGRPSPARAAVAALSSGTAALHLALQVLRRRAGRRRADAAPSRSLRRRSRPPTSAAGRASSTSTTPGTSTPSCSHELVGAPLGDGQPARRRSSPSTCTARREHGRDRGDLLASSTFRSIEDAAEAIGATRDGVPRGRYGRSSACCRSTATRSSPPAAAARSSPTTRRSPIARRYLATQARQPAPYYEHDEIGFNYRLGNLNAAVGRGQLRTLAAPHRRARARARAPTRRCLGAARRLGFQPSPRRLRAEPLADHGHGRSRRVRRVAGRRAAHAARGGDRGPARLQADAPAAGVRRRCRWSPTVAPTRCSRRSVSLPSSGRLTDDDVAWICDVIASSRP